LTAALGEVHRRGLVHKDVKPANCLVDDAGNVRLTGFGIASRVPRERQSPTPPEVIAGTLAYMAPEQTGRMNRSIDARSDLYSLGVTLYEMVTGVLPFTASDPMEWVHCHIARQPMSPCERVSGIPHSIAAIILKLLAKTAEDRYRTAAGVETDLRQCLAQWQARHHIDQFPLAMQDASDRLLISEKLYGRESEIDTLLAAFDQVVTHGTLQLALVSGYAGIGKSSIVNELHKVLVPPRGLFAAGKFDQYKRDIPYTTLAQAFRNLVRDLLGKSDTELARWRRALQEALGPNGQLMVNLIPELALIIGEQPPVPDLPPQDAQNRFQLVFQRFLGAFARPEHPLALFIDDLQWLDTATLTLIERLATDPTVRHLLLVGAYRDNEVGPAHPLARTLQAIRGNGANVHEITLAPLGLTDLGRLVDDALHAGWERVRSLAEMILEKTGGNPFFAIQFITALADEGLLSFDKNERLWQWNIEKIRAKGITDNLADLMAGKLTRLPPATQETLILFACLGNVAQTATLSTVQMNSEEQIHVALWEVVRTGLVLRLDGAYAFLHDRVQEAAYGLIPEGERAAMHLRIGRALASRTASEEIEEKIFEIVNQLNRGAALITSSEERVQVAALNLMAGKRAKDSTAYASALTYLDKGCALLAEDSWARQYRLRFDLEFHRAECEFLTGERGPAESRLSALSSRATNLIDRAATTCLQAALYTSLGRSDRAVEVGLEYLRHLGVEWSLHPTPEDVHHELERMWQSLAGRSIEELTDLPLMTNPDWRVTMDVLTEMTAPALFIDVNLLDLVLLRMVNLSLEHGNCAGSCFAYACLNMVLGFRFGDYQTAFRFGQLGCSLVERRGLERFRARVYMCFGVMVLPWTKDLLTGRTLINRALDAANAIGDVTFAVYSAKHLITNRLVSGVPLHDVQQAAERGLESARKAGFGLIVDCYIGQLMLIRALRGLPPDHNAGHSDSGFERRMEEEPHSAFAASFYWIHKLEERFYALDPTACIEAAAKAEGLLWLARSFLEVAEYHFYAALARAAVCDSASAPDQRQRHLDALLAHYEQIQVWAQNSPEKFSNRVALVGAEVARLTSRELDAEHLYEDAIRQAGEHGFVQNEALANELAARFYMARGLQTTAHAYLRNARYCYGRWGAFGKVRQLDQRYPRLHDQRGTDSPTLTTVGQLDLSTVVKMSQAISSEIVLDGLIEKLMVLAVEHAGAARGLLILPRDDEQRIAAAAVTGPEGITVHISQTALTPMDLPASVLRYVIRAQESVILDDASVSNQFETDEYIREKGARSVLCLPLVKQARQIGVLYLENNLTPYAFTPSRVEVLKLLASQAAISLENARLYADLQHTETYLSEAQRLSHTGSFGWNVTSGELFWSDEMFRIYGLDRATKPQVEMVIQRSHPEDIEFVRLLVDNARREGNDLDFEYRALMPDGFSKAVHVVAHAIKEDSGKLEYVGTVIDVTASRQAQQQLQASLEEKEALLKEVHHRVKNNLQMISSLLNLQAARITDPTVSELLGESRNRVRAMALVHENLYRAGNFARVPMSTHIQSLCAHLIRAYGLREHWVDLTTDVDEVELDLDRAVSVGLIISELVSNALKHAFPNARAGSVRVELKLLEEKRYALAVIDDGVGLPPDRDGRDAGSIGLQLVDDLTQQLHGTIAVKRGRGTNFTVTFAADGKSETRQ
jgi:PAS domain S-box-containing protein